jgi:4-amino-4-deoxy-L-arabinose transferase-like glycosyltransferase
VHEREWREATDLKPATVWLAVVLVVGAVLRLWAPRHGLPGTDEASIMDAIVGIMRTGDFNPHFFDYPGLVFWIHLPVACARFLIGATRAEWTSLAAVAPESFLPWSRIVTGVIGVATIVLVHQIGLRWGARHALLSAGLLAVMPLHVAESHVAQPDVPLTFFTTLCFLLSLVSHEKQTVRAFAAAGAAAGLAMATNYSAIIALVLPLITAWMTYPGRPSRLAYALSAAGAAIVAYLVAAPFTLLDLPGFLNGFGAFAARFRQQGDIGARAWLVYLLSLLHALGWPAFLLMFAGTTMGIVRATRGPGRVRWTLLVVFPVIVYVLVSRRGVADERALLPAIPFACVLAGLAVISGVSLLRRFNIPRAPRTALIVALTVAALLPPSLASVAYLKNLTRSEVAAAGHAGP